MKHDRNDLFMCESIIQRDLDNQVSMLS